MNISTVEGFCNVRGGFNGGCKDVYFVRAVGAGDGFAEKITKTDAALSGGTAPYNRISALPKLTSADDADYYSNCLKMWKGSKQKAVATKRTSGTPLAEALAAALQKILNVFGSAKQGTSESMKDNFAVKLLYWFDTVVPEFRNGYDGKETVKICADNITKLQEYLFFYMLILCGFDVLLFQSREDIGADLYKYGFSLKFSMGAFSSEPLPEYTPTKSEPQRKEAAPLSVNRAENIRVTIPERAGRTPTAANFANTAAVQSATAKEKSMEELAGLASSIVMIAIHNSRGDVIGTGSGIMISEKGYILTNNHVARGGSFYSVRIEDDDEVYRTDEIIKYNPVIDLAVIRIDRRLNPIPIYSGKKPVRGQKVVAIGSPLGLFNSVSDGIISGFRLIDSVEMIQFTAPISHGSSGGALLNMNG
ncbi:MAG: trypsin-like peptidase domain-containing protein, partial [Oscillospiraceae bacterium]|nr:trypsin-like peptidase domain-containing protein [Oscillospiraceae bacterium]